MNQIQMRAQILGNFFTYAVLFPVVASCSVLGVALSAIAILQKENGKLAKKSIEITGAVAGFPNIIFSIFVKFININAPFESVGATGHPKKASEKSFFYKRTSSKLFTAAVRSYHRVEPLKKHVFSRALFALGGITAIIARVADLALGLIAATFAILTLGMVKKLNDCAYNNLTFLCLIQDVVVAVRGLINPAVSQHLLAAPAPPVFVPPPTTIGDSSTPFQPKPKIIHTTTDPIPKELYEDCVLSKYECVIGFDPIRDPVLDPDGVHLYERAAILNWLETSETSPMTTLTLTANQLIEMPKLKALIDSRLALHAGKTKDFNFKEAADPDLQKAADLEAVLKKKYINEIKVNCRFDIYKAEAEVAQGL